MVTASAQWLPTRNMVLEGEGAWWHRPSRFDFTPESEAWSMGANALFRTEPRRVSVFVGGGGVYSRERRTGYFSEGCGPTTCLRMVATDGFGAAAIAGADLRVAGPLMAYGSIQFTTIHQAYVRVAGGLRFVALSAVDDSARRRAQRIGQAGRTEEGAAVGKDVRVSLTDGTRRKGKLVAITDAEVVTRTKQGEERHPIAKVLIVETVHHTARNAALVAAPAGFLAGWLGSCGSGDEEDCWPEMGALVGGVAAGGAALVGMWVDRANAEKHVVYSAPILTATVAPLLRPGTTGIALRVTWR